MKISKLAQFEEFLKTRIPTREALFMGTIGLDRAKYFMKLLGNPQDKIKIIHIAGTSGKGSTAHLTSQILHSQGFSVGLSISPHIFDIRERMQINSQLPSEKLVLKYFKQILPAILKMKNCKFGMPTFFEINVALAYYMFAKEKLDYAVMETGLGGRLDATNTVSSKNKICIITKLGLDHTEILGNTISKIASEKAGIIQRNNIVISHQQSVTAINVIKARCEKKHAKIFFINGEKNYSKIKSTSRKTIFDFEFNSSIQPVKSKSSSYKIDKLNLNLLGIHQAQNCSLALACLMLISKREKFKIDEEKLRHSLENISITGRMEIKKIGKQVVIFDGAHNPQKMSAFIKSLAKIFVQQKFTFILAFKKGKEFKKMLNVIIPIADKILVTHFSTNNMDNHHSSIDSLEIEAYLKSQNFKNFQTISNNKTAILTIIQLSNNPVIITGSLYLIAKIYPYFKK